MQSLLPDFEAQQERQRAFLDTVTSFAEQRIDAAVDYAIGRLEEFYLRPEEPVATPESDQPEPTTAGEQPVGDIAPVYEVDTARSNVAAALAVPVEDKHRVVSTASYRVNPSEMEGPNAN